DLAQPRELAAARLVPDALAQPVCRVIADLLEAHEVGQHQAASLDALREARDGMLELVDRLLVERGLRAGEETERLHLSLVRQVRDDGAVGLEPAQEVWPDQAAQWRIAVVRSIGQPLGERRELVRRAQQARVQEVVERPQISQAILDGRAGKRDAA